MKKKPGRKPNIERTFGHARLVLQVRKATKSISRTTIRSWRVCGGIVGLMSGFFFTQDIPCGPKKKNKELNYIRHPKYLSGMSLPDDVDILSNPDLRAEEKKALRYYTERGFQYISEYFYRGRAGLINRLRETKHSVEEIEKGIEKVKSTVKIIDNAFSHSHLSRDYTTYHGIKNPELEKIRELTIGDVYKKAGFLSLTYCIDVALREEFAELDENGELNILALKIHKDRPAIFIGNIPELMECEILLPRKKELKLVQISSTMIKDLNVQIKHRTGITDSTRINIFITQDVSS